MAKLHHMIEIDAPVEKVWEVLADLEAVRFYNPMVADSRYISPNREGIGASRHCDLKPNGFTKERVSGWAPNKSLSIELVDSAWPVTLMVWTTNLKPTGGGTLVSQDMEYRLKFGFLGKIMDILMMKRKLDRAISDVFLSFKKFVESGKKTS